MSTLLFSCLFPCTTPYLHKPSSSSSSSSSLLLSNFVPRTFSISFTKSQSFAIRASTAAVDVSVSGDQHLDISKLGISEEIVSALSRRGITELFPIQKAVLEPAMEGRDMIGRAITGSGKTLAFGIPIMDKIIRHRRRHRQSRVPFALVLAPTRELARQVQKEFKESAPNLSSICLYGGIPIINQARTVGFGVDIAVGTPGRIIDLVERGALNLSEVKFVVLDEADQMLNIGFQEDVECILNYLPPDRQSMLFSATMPSWVNEIARKHLRNPLVIDLVGASDQKLAEGISLYSIKSSASEKPNILSSLISRFHLCGKCIVFTKTKKDAEGLSRSMRGILGCRALHGNMQQPQRDKTLAAFRNGQFDVLVATDVAARGLDVPNVDLVIHFEIPNTSEIFVHRSGRTGRAGKKGTTILIFTESQRHAVRFIERDLRCKFNELPSITSDGNMISSINMTQAHFKRYNETVEDLNVRSDSFAASQFRNNRGIKDQDYRNARESRGQHACASKQSEGQFSAYQRFGRNRHSENLGRSRNAYFKTRYDKFNKFDDLESNNYSNSVSRYMKSSGRHSKSIPNFQFDETDSFMVNRKFDYKANSIDKHSNTPKSGIDFKEILGALRDHQ